MRYSINDHPDRSIYAKLDLDGVNVNALVKLSENNCEVELFSDIYFKTAYFQSDFISGFTNELKNITFVNIV